MKMRFRIRALAFTLLSCCLSFTSFMLSEYSGTVTAKTHLDELLLIRLSLIVAAILALVRMKLQRQLLVCLLDFFAAGALPQTEHGVVVSLLLSLSLSTTALLLSPSAVLGARALEEQEEDQRRGQHRRTPLHCCHGGLLAVIVRIIMTTIAGEATWNLEPVVRT